MKPNLLHELRIVAPTRETRQKVWRAMPVTGPLFHVSADGKPHLNSIEFYLRLTQA